MQSKKEIGYYYNNIIMTEIWKTRANAITEVPFAKRRLSSGPLIDPLK